MKSIFMPDGSGWKVGQPQAENAPDERRGNGRRLGCRPFANPYPPSSLKEWPIEEETKMFRGFSLVVS
jgi:hypothetical protein